jgi:hypothetical protein
MSRVRRLRLAVSSPLASTSDNLLRNGFLLRQGLYLSACAGPAGNVRPDICACGRFITSSTGSGAASVLLRGQFGQRCEAADGRVVPGKAAPAAAFPPPHPWAPTSTTTLNLHLHPSGFWAAQSVHKGPLATPLAQIYISQFAAFLPFLHPCVFRPVTGSLYLAARAARRQSSRHLPTATPCSQAGTLP